MCIEDNNLTHTDVTLIRRLIIQRAMERAALGYFYDLHDLIRQTPQQPPGKVKMY